jgi:hypothetical protein
VRALITVIAVAFFALVLYAHGAHAAQPRASAEGTGVVESLAIVTRPSISSVVSGGTPGWG